MLTFTTVPESVAKRKTLVERAGETHSLSRSHASQPRSTAHRTATTLHHRNAHSTSSNIGRPPSAQSMARSAVRYHSKRGNDNLDGNDDHEEDALSRRQGITPFYSLSDITIRKTRTAPHAFAKEQRAKTQHLSSSDPIQSCTVRGQGSGGYCDRTVSSPIEDLASRRALEHPREVSLAIALRKMRLGTPPERRESLLEKARLRHNMPKESSTTKLPRSVVLPPSPAPSDHIFSPSSAHRKDGRSRMARRPIARKPNTAVFLTKEKLTSVAAWDTSGRLDDMVSTILDRADDRSHGLMTWLG